MIPMNKLYTFLNLQNRNACSHVLYLFHLIDANGKSKNRSCTHSMDIATLLGIIIGLAALIGGFLWEGGEIGGLMQLTSALIVFGGTIAAVLISFPVSKLRTVPKALALAFSSRQQDSGELIEDIVGMATVARREGVLALEKSGGLPESFLREGIQLVVDGTERTMVQQIMSLEIDALEKNMKATPKFSNRPAATRRRWASSARSWALFTCSAA